MSKTNINSILPEIIGLPPTVDERHLGINGDLRWNMSDVVRDTMPILEIVPRIPSSKASVDFFKTEDDMEGYEKNLNEYGIGLPANTRTLKFAIMGNSFPVQESFTNDYGESMFEGMIGEASNMAQNLSFLTNTPDMTALQSKIDKFIDTGTIANGSIGLLGNIPGIGSDLENMTKSITGSEKFKQILGTAGNIMLGNRIDLPQIWRNANWSPTFSANIRLYNPNPADNNTTIQYITAPLAALLLFVVPKAGTAFKQESGKTTISPYTYTWPWMCSYSVSGLYSMKSGYIKSISVVKGGDDNHIAYNQRPGIVDVRIEFGTLYQTMVNGGAPDSTDRPLLSEFLREFTRIDTSSKWTTLDENGSHAPDWSAHSYPAGVLTRTDSSGTQEEYALTGAKAEEEEPPDRNTPQPRTSQRSNLLTRILSGR